MGDLQEGWPNLSQGRKLTGTLNPKEKNQYNTMHFSQPKQIFAVQEVTQELSDVPSALLTCLALAFVKNKIAA